MDRIRWTGSDSTGPALAQSPDHVARDRGGGRGAWDLAASAGLPIHRLLGSSGSAAATRAPRAAVEAGRRRRRHRFKARVDRLQITPDRSVSIESRSARRCADGRRRVHLSRFHVAMILAATGGPRGRAARLLLDEDPLPTTIYTIRQAEAAPLDHPRHRVRAGLASPPTPLARRPGDRLPRARRGGEGRHLGRREDRHSRGFHMNFDPPRRQLAQQVANFHCKAIRNCRDSFST